MNIGDQPSLGPHFLPTSLSIQSQPQTQTQPSSGTLLAPSLPSILAPSGSSHCTSGGISSLALTTLTTSTPTRVAHGCNSGGAVSTPPTGDETNITLTEIINSTTPTTTSSYPPLVMFKKVVVTRPSKTCMKPPANYNEGNDPKSYLKLIGNFTLCHS